MSRFFATASDSESESSSEEEQVIRQPVATFTFSDDEEDTKRVVRSAREKRFEDLTNTIKQMRNYKKIKDLSSMLSSFEDLTRVYTKAYNTVILKEENGITPRFYIRCLVEMEEFINEIWDDKEGRKNLSKNNAKSLGTLRQKFRKYLKDFEDDIVKFREHPDLPDENEEKDDESDSDSDDENVAASRGSALKKSEQSAGEKSGGGKGAATGADDDDGSDDSIDWGTDSETTSSSSDEEGQYQSIRERFLKKTTDKEEDEKKEKKKERKEKPRKQKKDDDDDDEDDDGGGEWETVKGGASIPSERPKMFAKDAEINTQVVIKKLNEILAARGKKRTDRRDQIELLHELQNIAQLHNLGPAVAIKLKMGTISAIFDYNPKISDPMKPDYWCKLLDRVSECVDIILSCPNIEIKENLLDEDEVYDKSPYVIRGFLITIVERLDEEFTKLLKECDPHSNEYVQRLKDETRVTEIIDKVQTFLEREKDPSQLCRIYIRKIEHLYYKFDPTVLKQKNGEISSTETTSVHIMERLCKYIYDNDDTDRLRTRAILGHVYHHALHDNWFQARDLMLMSHLQETIQHSDPSTQILYNRTMANLGLCAFRQGNVKDAHNCLIDLMMTAKVKELLAQGLLPQRQHERSKEQEKIEKQRQMPFHMHINSELLECVYLVAAMLIEIPYMAAHEFDARRRMISKTFYQQLRSSERQSLVGPPESMREHIVAASKAMRNGNWTGCVNYIVNEKMNAKVWDLFYDSDKVRDMLVRLIKEESLRTYLFTYSNVYSSISVKMLAQMFELKLATVHSTISKMIINEELMASLDDPSQTVVMHRTEPSRLQSLSIQLADKVNIFVDSNERIFETKQGAFYQRNQAGGNQDGGQRNMGQNNMFRQNYRQNTGGGGASGSGMGDWKRRNYNN